MEPHNFDYSPQNQQFQPPAPATYTPYESLQPIDPSVDINALLEWTKVNLQEKAQWSNNLAALGVLRQLNKFNTQHMNEICRLVWPALIVCLSSLKPVIAKTSMMFLQELFHHCGTTLYDEIIISLEPAIVLKVHSDKAFLKQEAQKAYQIMIEKCLKDATLVAVCNSCRSKNPQISELSMKALERMISLIGSNITQLQPLTFKELFLVIIVSLDGKRAEMQKSAENLVKGMYQLLGDQNFGHLVNAMISEQVLKAEDMLKIQRVFEEKESKPKEHLADVLKTQRILKTNEKLQNSVQQNYPNSETPKNYGNNCPSFPSGNGYQQTPAFNQTCFYNNQGSF